MFFKETSFFVSCCFLVLLFAGCSHSAQPNIKDGRTFKIEEGRFLGEIDTQWLKNLLLNDEVPLYLQIVDVRSSKEFQRGHLKEAISIDARNISPNEFVKKLPKNKIIILSCDLGLESKKAYERLVKEDIDVSNIRYFYARVQILPSGKYIIREKIQGSE